MTLTREGYGRHKPIIVTCDECGETFETGSSDLNTARDRAVRRGWLIKKVKKVWSHICDECQIEGETTNE